LFAKSGYRVAILARNPRNLNNLAESIQSTGGEVAPFPVQSYTRDNIKSTFDAIKSHWPTDEIRAAVWNAGFGAFKTFLELTEEEVKESVETNVLGPFAFAREAILNFRELDLNDQGKRGTLIFTGATASIRGNTYTSAFSAGKHGLRALSQSLAKEFGKDNIHVAHSIIDGAILTDRTKEYTAEDNVRSEAAKLNPDSIANVSGIVRKLYWSPTTLWQAYLFLAGQDQSAFTWELDLRPAHEKW